MCYPVHISKEGTNREKTLMKEHAYLAQDTSLRYV